MMGRRISLGLDSFSLHLHYQYGDFSVFDLLSLVERWHLDGVQINLNGPGNRHLSGDTPEHYQRLMHRFQARGYFVELASAGTDPQRLAPVLELCRYLGGDRVRTVVVAGEEPEQELAAAPGNLRELARVAQKVGVHVLIENHEDLAAEQLLELVQWVGSEWVGVLFDVGNSLVLREDPVAAAQILAPFTMSVHLKDQVVVQAEDGLRSVGTRLGHGAIDLAAIVDILRRSSPCDRVLVQLCYGYSQILIPERELRAGGRAAPSVERLWQPVPGPHDPAERLLPEHLRDGVDEKTLLVWELDHLQASVRYARDLLGR